MAKPRLSTGRIPFQLGLDTAVAPVAPIVNACAVLSHEAKPLATMTLAGRSGTLYQQIKPIAGIAQTIKPIASIAQRPC